MPAVPFADALRGRIRTARQSRGLSYNAISRLTGIEPAVVLRIESGAHANVYLDHLVALARALDIHPADLACGAVDPRAYPSSLTEDAFDEWVRRRLRADRGALGTPALAKAAGMTQSTVVRWESGAYRRLDVIRLDRLAGALGVTLSDWLSPTP